MHALIVEDTLLGLFDLRPLAQSPRFFQLFEESKGLKSAKKAPISARNLDFGAFQAIFLHWEGLRGQLLVLLTSF